MTLSNKVALVTGGAMGIGFAVCEHLAEQGARVVIADLDNAQAAADKLKQKGHQAIGVKTNVSEEGDTENMVKTALDEFGQLDILVN
ncbi:MAG TPA: dehydrogenase, partial [Pusillimonas sp.]|nr:dehydrogenase [Pusillimonas sp.]